jgi:ribosome biogenesis GTPase A
MTYKIEADSFLNDLDRVTRVRYEVANSLGRIADTLSKSESEGKQNSGGLGLETQIEDINIASKNLRSGVFRLLVLGDMKRGKSTFLNALIGENLLPSDVNPMYCLANGSTVRFRKESYRLL